MIKALKTIGIVLLFAALGLSGSGTGVPAVNAAAASLLFLPAVSNQSAGVERLGPFLGTVMSLAVDPTQPGVLYAGTWGSGVYKSSDRGRTWAPVNLGLDNLLVQALAVDYQSPAYVYAGTYYNPGVASGVYVSPDGGLTWQPGGPMINIYGGQPVDRPVVYALAADPNNAGVVYAGTRMKNLVPGQEIYGGGGVFKTLDHAATWQTANDGLPADDLYVYDIDVDPGDPLRVYAALHQSGAYGSDSGGAGWTNLGAPDGSGRAIAVDPLDPRTLFFGVWHGMGLLRGADLGASWSLSGLTELRVGGLAFDPRDSNFAYATTAGMTYGPTPGLFKSSDHARSWTPASLDYSFSQVAVDPFDGAYVYAGTIFHGLLRSTNRGASWSLSNWGLSGFAVSGLAADPNSPATLYAALSQWGVMKSTDRGANWSLASAGLPENANLSALAMDPADPQVLYAATSDAGICVTRDGAATWAALADGYPALASAAASAPPSPADDPLRERSIVPLAQRDADQADERAALESAVLSPAAGLSLAVSPASRAVLAGTQGSGIRRLAGAAWSATSQASGSAYTFLFASTGKVFAGMDAASGSLLVSSDDGQTWQPSAVGLNGRVVYALSQSAAQAGLYYAGTDAGLFRSLDGGATWTQAGLAGQAVTAVFASPDQAAVVTAGGPEALYLSRDQGVEWAESPEALRGYGIRAILADPADPHTLYLATRFGGVVCLRR